PFAAGADEILERGIEVERIAHLVEVRYLQVRAAAHAAAVGLDLAQDQLEQGGLARAVWSDQADLVAAQDRAAEVAHDGAAAIRLGNLRQLGDALPARLARRHVHADAPERLAPRRARRAQRLQASDAALASRAARLHTLAYPDFFLRQQPVGLALHHRFLR